MTSDHFNGLTPGEAERLAFLAEEMGEALQAVGKILRHGYESQDPTMPPGLTNRQQLEQELGDVRCAMIMLCDVEDLSKDSIHDRAKAKMEIVLRWMHHQ